MNPIEQGFVSNSGKVNFLSRKINHLSKVIVDRKIIAEFTRSVSSTKSLFNTLYIERDPNIKKIPSDKINVTKKHSFSFVSSNSWQFYFLQFVYELKHMSSTWRTCSWSTFIFLRLRVGFSIFDSVSFLVRFIFLFNKNHGLFDFKTSQFLSK